MKTPYGNCLLLLALVAAGAIHAAEGEAVINSTKRQEVLNLAKSLLSTPSPAVVGRDPFHSEEYAASIAGGGGPSSTTVIVPDKPTPTGPRTPRDLLQAIATSATLKPSGYFVLSGQPTLVFGQKRVKAGGLLTITFEGTEYPLEIVSIIPPNFTLRLNREEFTRPIK
jgi:hypothetical protein